MARSSAATLLPTATSAAATRGLQKSLIYDQVIVGKTPSKLATNHSVCQHRIARGEILSSLHLSLLAQTQNTSVSVCVYVCCKCKVYISRSKVFYTGGTTVFLPACQTRAYVLSRLLSQSHVQLPALESRSRKTRGRTREGRASRVRSLRLGWKNTFFHMLLLSELCWLILALGSDGEEASRNILIAPKCERSGPMLLWEPIKHQI